MLRFLLLGTRGCAEERLETPSTYPPPCSLAERNRPVYLQKQGSFPQPKAYLNMVSHSFSLGWGQLITGFLPFVTSSFLFLVMPGATSSVQERVPLFSRSDPRPFQEPAGTTFPSESPWGRKPVRWVVRIGFIGRERPLTGFRQQDQLQEHLVIWWGNEGPV